MKCYLVAICFVLLSSGLCLGQDSSSPGASPASRPAAGATSERSAQTSAGAVMMVELSKSLDSRKLKPGDAVTAKTTAELRMPDGTAVPRGSKVMGHVTQASQRSQAEAESSLGLEFDKIVFRNGTEIDVKSKIQAVGPPPYAMYANAPNMSAPGGIIQPGATPTMPGPGGTSQTAPGMPAGGASGGYNVPGGSAGQQTQTEPVTLTEQSRGVIGLSDLRLGPDSVLTSSEKSVKLDSGTRLVLRGVQSQ